jgi:hypothetical protein
MKRLTGLLFAIGVLLLTVFAVAGFFATDNVEARLVRNPESGPQIGDVLRFRPRDDGRAALRTARVRDGAEVVPAGHAQPGRAV